MTYKHNGFTLIEVAVALFILGLLLSGIVPSLGSQFSQRQLHLTRQQLDDAQQALLGFAMANHRLPCPASPSSHGEESFCTSDQGACVATTVMQNHGRCSHPFTGYLPAASLALSPITDQGYSSDAWNFPLHYAVANNTINGINNPFTRPNGIASAGITHISNSSLLYICDSASGSNQNNCGSAIKLTDKTPAIVYSIGKTSFNTPDELANTDDNPVFVSHTPNEQYDDTLQWLSPAILFSKMVAAGSLP